MEFDSMSLEELFATADSITDYRSDEEREEIQRELAEAIAELGELIGE
jgi:hypothetical protein